MNILLLAAGKGERFQKLGYLPKPLIEVDGIPMWKRVLENLLTQLPMGSYKNVYVATLPEYNITSEEYTILNLQGEQKGATYSALSALYQVEPDQGGHGSVNWKWYGEPLLILNCDQLIEFDGAAFLEALEREDPGGLLFHFTEPNKENKWGRSIIDGSLIKEIVEKTPVSNAAHCGIYYFRLTCDFMDYAEDMVQGRMYGDMKVNGEHFLSPVYNLMIKEGEVVVPFFVNKFIPLGVPSDLENYLRNA